MVRNLRREAEELKRKISEQNLEINDLRKQRDFSVSEKKHLDHSIGQRNGGRKKSKEIGSI